MRFNPQRLLDRLELTLWLTRVLKRIELKTKSGIMPWGELPGTTWMHEDLEKKDER